MHIGLFGEATSRVGAGHAMRLVAVGQAAEALGHQVTYLGPIVDIPWVQAMISRWHPTTDSAQGVDWIVVDTYDPQVLSTALQTTYASRLAVIIDAETPHVSADLYVAPGVQGTTGQRPATAAAHVLEGIPYLLIRHEIRRRVYEPNRRDPFVLVTLGGSAGEFESGMVVSVVRSAGWRGRIVALTFEGRPWIDLDTMTEVQPTGSSLPELAQKCTLAISAAGVTSWELLSMGVPLGLVCLSSDQVDNYEWATRSGGAVPLGRLDEDAALDANAVHVALNSSSLLRGLSRRGRHLVDGKGAERIVASMVGYAER